jgi:hypothetical protein
VAYTHHDLGRVYLKLGRIDEAIAVLAKALPWFEQNASAKMRDEVKAALDEARAARK